METILKKWGSSVVVVLPKEFREINKLKEGDTIDITIKKMKGGIQK